MYRSTIIKLLLAERLGFYKFFLSIEEKGYFCTEANVANYKNDWTFNSMKANLNEYRKVILMSTGANLWDFC